MLRLRKLSTRLMLSHVLVATVTSLLITLVMAVLLGVSLGLGSSGPLSGNSAVAMISAFTWLFGLSEEQAAKMTMPLGYTLVVDADDIVVYRLGETGCQSGMALAECAPELSAAPPGERTFQEGDMEWAQVILPTVTGHRYISQRQVLSVSAALPSLFQSSLLLTTLSVPIALILAWLTSGRLTRRLTAITHITRQFADGVFSARAADSHQDDIGQLAQQFNSMADALEQNVSALRDLAQRNAELAQQAENAAVLAERARLSRDLHDTIAQRLFSLSMSSQRLPELIERDALEGAKQARRLAALAEQTLLDLRALLVDLRPSSVIQRGLADALQTLCDEWQAMHNIPVECSLLLSGQRIPSSLEDVLYRVTQEALSNVARHAAASRVMVSILEGHQQIVLSVTDNGKGFDATQTGGNGHFGLMSIRERARAIGGQVLIESEPGRSTLQLTLPLEREIP